MFDSMESVANILDASLLAGDEPITQVAARLIADAPDDERERVEATVELWFAERAGVDISRVVASGEPLISDYVGIDA